VAKAVVVREVLGNVDNFSPGDRLGQANKGGGGGGADRGPGSGGKGGTGGKGIVIVRY
jgi:hypothetical protein